MKCYSQARKNSIAICQWKILQTLTINMQKKSLEKLWNTKFRRISWSIPDTLLLANAFKKFGTKCSETSEFDPTYFFQHQDQHGKHEWRKQNLSWDLWSIVMLLMVEKGIRDGMCHAVHLYAKANNKYMKD